MEWTVERGSSKRSRRGGAVRSGEARGSGGLAARNHQEPGGPNVVGRTRRRRGGGRTRERRREKERASARAGLGTGAAGAAGEGRGTTCDFGGIAISPLLRRRSVLPTYLAERGEERRGEVSRVHARRSVSVSVTSRHDGRSMPRTAVQCSVCKQCCAVSVTCL